MRATPLAPFLLLLGCAGEGSGVLDLETQTVTRSDLRVTVRESGQIKAAQNTRVASKLEGWPTLIYLIPEGSVVEEGDKLAELDVSGVEESRANQAIAVAKSAAALDQARKNLDIMENGLMAARSAAQSVLRIAEMREEKFLGQRTVVRASAGGGSIAGTNQQMIHGLRELLDSEFAVNAAAEVNYSDLVNHAIELLGEDNLDLEMGEMANQILQKIDQISLSRADLKLAEEKLGHSQRLFEEKFITRNELDSDDISHKRQLSSVTLAWNDLELLLKFTLQEDKITLDQDVRNAKLELASVIASNDAARVRDRAELLSVEAEHELASERLANYSEQIANSVIYAPTPGLVVYVEGRGRDRGHQPMEEGINVREGQAFIELPDVRRMMVELKVHEAQIDEVKVGQRAIVKLDAFPERTFPGTVKMVGNLPDSSMQRSKPGLKLYQTTVELDGENSDQALRPGMNATAEILIEVRSEVLNVPFAGVQHEGEVSYVWKVTPEGPVAQIVELGRSNLSHVEITTGVQEGDRITLGKPKGLPFPEFPRNSR